MKHHGIDFRETLIRLDQENTQTEIRKFSPSAKVPVLIDGGLTIWESLAIMEYLNEKFREYRMWPTDQHLRAHARAISSEMHSGFLALRQHLPFHALKRIRDKDLTPVADDIARIKEIWSETLRLSRGPFLGGAYFTIADAMYAPVIGRFQTYGVSLDGVLADYSNAILNLPAVQEWYAQAQAELDLSQKQ